MEHHRLLPGDVERFRQQLQNSGDGVQLIFPVLPGTVPHIEEPEQLFFRPGKQDIGHADGLIGRKIGGFGIVLGEFPLELPRRLHRGLL